MPKPDLMTLSRALVELALRALEDAQAEIEAFEKQTDWYSASVKMMTRIEQAAERLDEELQK